MQQTSDYTLLIWLLAVLTVVILLGCGLLVTYLLRLLAKQTELTANRMTSLLQAQTVENQSLRNQLRSSDVQTLHGLNSATAVPRTQADLTSDELILTADEDIIYQEALRRQGFREGGLSDDLAAAGWGSVLTQDTSPELYRGSGDEGGSPVVFGNTDEPS